ncbi:MAG: hypothetical protein JW929_06660 [Anaerolineales bacterium]|nr:hypothetical protein [Anaerolineales bacterium]
MDLPRGGSRPSCPYFLAAAAASFLRLLLGIAGGLILLEILLRFNPPLLAGLRGLGAPAPVDSPLSVFEYDVYTSDADQIFWRPDLIRPIPPGEDRLEAHIRLETDEFGFRNTPPLPAEADLVVLGRSFSLGAQSQAPWPEQFADLSGWRVVNLSQPGSSPEVKRDFLTRFGLPRRPKWVVVEVEPPLDAMRFRPSDPWMIQLLPIPIAQEYLRRFFGIERFLTADPIYPLEVDLPGRTYPLVCCVHYLDALTLTVEEWQASRGWKEFTAAVSDLAREAAEGSSCTAILYAPTKPEIYFPLALDPSQLTPALRDLVPLRLDANHEVVVDAGRIPDILRMRANALAARDALAAYAAEHNLVFVDPTGLMVAAVLRGEDPFMAYDSHWNATGHALVAQAVWEALAGAECG